jgi:transcriptional regulator with XRE-family HTH domain
MARLAAEQEFDREIGARIRAARRARGLSQTELGRLVGVTFQQVRKYELGTNRIPLARLMVIAPALRIGIEALLPPSACPETGSTPRTRPDPDALILAEKVAALPAGIRGAVERLVGTLSGG